MVWESREVVLLRLNIYRLSLEGPGIKVGLSDLALTAVYCVSGACHTASDDGQPLTWIKPQLADISDSDVRDVVLIAT